MIVFLPFLPSCSSYLVAFGEFTFQKFVTIQLFGLEICAVRQDSFYPDQDYGQVSLYKKSSLYFLGSSFRSWENAAYLQSVKNFTISTKV